VTTKFSKGNNSSAKLTPEQVVWGREQYDLHIRTRGREGYNMRQLADIQEVSRETVARYIRGETWKQYGGPGEHQDATAPSSAAELHDAALQRQATLMAPAPQSAEIQASLAKLGTLLKKEEPK
jgi:hypothetical protein